MVGLAGACRSPVQRAAPLYGRLSPLSRPRRVRRARQSIYQDVKEEKLKGVRSLIKYATLSDYMLIPTDERKLEGLAPKYPEWIPGYGDRGWCRVEYFIFSLAAEMREHEVEHGQDVRQRLTAARLVEHDHISSLQRRWKREPLDVRWLGKVHRGEGGQP